MKKVLIITYYWPPSGGAGVQRWLKTTKYLRKYGWEPIIYTPDNPEAPAMDPSLLDEVPDNVEVLKTKIWEPYGIYTRLMGKKKNHSTYLTKKSKKSILAKLAEWIRSNVFIPDPRMFWIKPSVKYLTKYLKQQPVDIIVSTGPPHSMHLIGLGVKKKTNIPWIADFRDPWTFIYHAHHFPFSKKTQKKHLKLEAEVVKQATARTVVSPGWQKQYKELLGEPFDVVYNGFDTADFENQEEVPLDTSFSISHVGSMSVDRNPEVLWQVLKELVKENEVFAQALKIRLTGQVNPETIQQLHSLGLKKNLELIDYMPHDEALRQNRQSQLLLLLINNAANIKGLLPGKLYEYLAAKRPIIAIAPPNADVVGILRETGGGKAFDFKDRKSLKAYVLQAFELYQNGELNVENNNIGKYTRENQAAHFAQIFDRITKV